MHSSFTPWSSSTCQHWSRRIEPSRTVASDTVIEQLYPVTRGCFSVDADQSPRIIEKITITGNVGENLIIEYSGTAEVSALTLL
mmetsp:Transcript_10934/g.21650  ORF Transcript_10934/g.21650 Transcript_10934/m.21650 type:complete len:84 (+) Transcript_10934:1298-1549(+)